MTTARLRPDAARYASYPSLRDRSVFITGGASGIGAELVAQFARQGAQVGFIDIQHAAAADVAAELKAELGTAPWYAACDVGDVPRLRAAISACAAELGPVDVLVNNAADDERSPLDELTEQFWDEKFRVNLRPMIFAAQAVAPEMRIRGARLDHQPRLDHLAGRLRQCRLLRDRQGRDRRPHPFAGPRSGTRRHPGELPHPRLDDDRAPAGQVGDARGRTGDRPRAVPARTGHARRHRPDGPVAGRRRQRDVHRPNLGGRRRLDLRRRTREGGSNP